MNRWMVQVVWTMALVMLAVGSQAAGKKAVGNRVPRPYTAVQGLEKVDFSRHSIQLKALYAGCPRRDCIPALKDPKLVSLDAANVPRGILGILVSVNGQHRYYPYNILVWHEIINDRIGDSVFAVTYCPLCGTGMVFDRRVEGRVLTFGVSGTLYQSNLMMYDDTTYSLWSQAESRAVVGTLTGTDLKLLPMQLLTVEEVRQRYPDARVVSTDTGYDRDYSRYPYGDYEDSARILFPVSKVDHRFPLKELFYVFPVSGHSVAFRFQLLDDGATVFRNMDGRSVSVCRSGGELTVRVDGQEVAGYYEMWFSWALHNDTDGVVWEPDDKSH